MEICGVCGKEVDFVFETDTGVNILLNGIINMKRIISDFKKINYNKLDEKITAYYSILTKVKEICDMVYNYNKDELTKIIEIHNQISEEIYTSV